MRINTGHLNAWARSIHFFNLCILIRQKAVASHARVNLNMRLCLHAAALRDFIQALRRLRRTDCRNRVRLHDLIRFIRHRGRAHDENVFLGIAPIAQALGVLRLGHGKHADAGLLQDLCHLLHAKAVAVCLEYGKYRHARLFLNDAGIFLELFPLNHELFHVTCSLSACCPQPSSLPALPATRRDDRRSNSSAWRYPAQHSSSGSACGAGCDRCSDRVQRQSIPAC